MRLSTLFISAMAFLAAAGICLVASGFLATAVEQTTEITVRHALDDHEIEWAEVEADGLQVILTGTAPTEARRFHAVSTVGEVVDSARIINAMDVAPTKALAPPRFSVEILRNESGISVIGLIPLGVDREELVKKLVGVAGEDEVTDLMETADYPVPPGWDDALAFTMIVLEKLPRSKISVDAGQVTVTAISDSVEEKRKLERELKRAAPPGLRFTLSIAAPRPVITPFNLRYLIDEKGARFDACSADTDEGRSKILAAAEAAGGNGGTSCRLGLGVPSPAWAEAVAQSIAALKEIGAGSVTFADADITLVAAEGTPPAVFDRVIGELESTLPPVFALHSVLPVPEGRANAGPPEFVVTLSPEGQVQLRGRVADDNLKKMADAYAKARFGSASVHTAARTADNLPIDWAVRVLSGIEALSRLTHGAVTVTPDNLTVRGIASREDAQAEIAGMLSEQLGEAETYVLDITYQAPPPPEDMPLTPEMCESAIAEAQRALGKITFEPGSATIIAESQRTMDAISEILSDCDGIKLEIQGHTDSQGRTSMNQQLSQDRAQSVLNELHSRRILTSNFTAKGYGETLPIAENDTEEGREANRRIEFRLILPEPVKERESTLDAVAKDGGALDAPEEEAPAEDPPADGDGTASGNPDADGTGD